MYQIVTGRKITPKMEKVNGIVKKINLWKEEKIKEGGNTS